MSDSVQDETEPTPEQDPEADGTPGTTTDASAGEPGDIEETKRKFRAALDRKKQASARDAGTTGARGTGKAAGAGGPATSRRQFRRKSG